MVGLEREGIEGTYFFDLISVIFTVILEIRNYDFSSCAVIGASFYLDEAASTMEVGVPHSPHDLQWVLVVMPFLYQVVSGMEVEIR